VCLCVNKLFDEWTHSPDLCVMHHIAVVHPSHYSNPCIGYQSSNMLSTNRRYDVQCSTTPAAILHSPAHWSTSTLSLSALIKFCPTHCSIYQNSNLSSGFLHLHPVQLFDGIVCHPHSEKHHHNLDLCADSKDIFFNESSVDHCSRRLCVVAV